MAHSSVNSSLSMEALVSKFFKEFESMTKRPEERFGIKPDAKRASLLKKSTKDVYDFCRQYDTTYGSAYINNLVVDNFDDEQVWQQLELHNDATARGVLETFATSDLEKAVLSFSCQKVNSDSQTQSAKLQIQPSKTGSGLEKSKKEKDGDSDTDNELEQIKKRLSKADDSDFMDEDSVDEELFKVNDLQDSEEDINDQAESDSNFDFEVPKTKKEDAAGLKKKAEKTPVDDKFFKLAKMEEFLEQEDKKERKQQQGETTSDSEGEGSDDVDVFGELPDEEEEGAMYADFFDPPDEDGAEDKENTERKQSNKRKMSVDSTGDEDKLDIDKDEGGLKKKVHFSEDSAPKKLVGSSKTGDNNDDALNSLSTFEKRQEKLQKQISALEEASLQPRSWSMSGEVSSSMRPENSLLEEHLTFDHTSRTAPEITEETTMKLEDIIKQRIKDKAWDDVIRKKRMKEEVFEFKKRIQLDQEKSKISLSQIYEQEYLKQQAEEEEDKKNPLHEEVSKMMHSLFLKLDALSNFCYTPKPAVPEVKIISNMPSILMEEIIPVAVSDAALLAPEEVQARTKGEVKGKAERTGTDKNRERKKKKKAQRERQREKEKRQKAVEKINPGLGNKYSKERALRELEKQSKTSGNVQLVQDKKEKVSSSSKAFFAQLQEEVQTQLKAKASVARSQKAEKKSSKSYLL